MYKNSVEGIFYAVGALISIAQNLFQSIFLMGAFYAAMDIRPCLHPKNGRAVLYQRLPGGMKIEAK